MENNSIEIKFKTLTPLWTGDVDGKCTKIKETGIIGSLRWWYEALVRGLGGYACDPTSNDSCELNQEKFNKATKSGKSVQESLDELICPACQLFGCTGWKKRFRLEISGGKEVYDQDNLRMFNIQPSGRSNGWFFGSGVISDDENKIDLKIDADYDKIGEIKLLLGIIQEWGGICARTQVGYGVVNFRENGEKFKVDENIINELDIKESNSDKRIVDLSDFFFAKVKFEVDNRGWTKKVDGLKENQIKNTHMTQSRKIVYEKYPNNIVPTSPAIKNYLRFEKFSDLSRAERNYIFGSSKACPECYEELVPDRDNPKEKYYCKNCEKRILKDKAMKISSKINVSFAYSLNKGNEWEFRIWGYIPSEMPGRLSINRKNLLQKLKTCIEKPESEFSSSFGSEAKFFSLEWREFDSERDTKQKTSDIKEFIRKNLLGEILK